MRVRLGAGTGVDWLMAAMETKAHLELLVARGQATRVADADGVVTFEGVSPGTR